MPKLIGSYLNILFNYTVKCSFFKNTLSTFCIIFALYCIFFLNAGEILYRLSFCDLAGSERAAKSQTTGMRLKEAGCINTSLLVLGRCMEQLRLNSTLKYDMCISFLSF